MTWTVVAGKIVIRQPHLLIALTESSKEDCKVLWDF
jgi:hypothetical protein